VSYDDAIGHVVDVVDGVGAAIMVVGALGAFLLFAQRVRRGTERAYEQLREDVDASSCSDSKCSSSPTSS
jgi:hypothetical protein